MWKARFDQKGVGLQPSFFLDVKMMGFYHNKIVIFICCIHIYIYHILKHIYRFFLANIFELL